LAGAAKKGSMRNYKSIFERVEKALLDEASKVMPRSEVQAALDEFKHVLR
jgi:hypothetical protein